MYHILHVYLLFCRDVELKAYWILLLCECYVWFVWLRTASAYCYPDWNEMSIFCAVHYVLAADSVQNTFSVELTK